jgi:AcrR family transcriptional regulator
MKSIQKKSAGGPQTRKKGATQTPKAIPEVPVREPQQGRSRESYLRVLAATEKLLEDRGTADFTLNEVSRVGKVSIGSIYCRFSSKDELIHAVVKQKMKIIETNHNKAIGATLERTDSLLDFMPQMINDIAETLYLHAPFLKAVMHIANNDPFVDAVGTKVYLKWSEKVHQSLLTFRNEIVHPDPERAVRSVYRIVYAALARFLGFGAEGKAGTLEGDWTELKEDLCQMCTAFLLIKLKRTVA